MMRILATLALALPLAAQIKGPLLDAHNCYPYMGQHADRIERALSLGFPISIEQDVALWDGHAVVSHTAKTTGVEPTLREHFFERVRPLMDKAFKENRRDTWPLIVVHFDFKDVQKPLLEDVWKLLGEYEGWLTTTKKSSDPNKLGKFDMKPLLVLTEEADEQEVVFYNEVKVGTKLRLFGSAHTKDLTARATNYRRWLNYSWKAVEPEGQPKAGDWSPEDAARLKNIVDRGHSLGYWVRFYTLDGFTAEENQGWDASYNFGSHEAVTERWKAAMDANVDLIATDQYEMLAKLLAIRRN
ncbi:MAG TPA: hypothetical protein VNH18_04020 [Bryobacteraceae bacterium]|nr:hypothetical protein [Bryobacteraceae bacterium]